VSRPGSWSRPRREIDDVVQAHHPNCFAVVDDREVCDPTFSKCVEGFTDRRVGAALISFSVYASRDRYGAEEGLNRLKDAVTRDDTDDSSNTEAFWRRCRS